MEQFNLTETENRKKEIEIALDFGELTPAEVKLAEFELRETPERKAEALDAFRSIIKQDGTLIVPDCDHFLNRFLRPTKFYPTSAFKLLRDSLEFKELHGPLLHNLMPSDEENAFKSMGAVNILAQRDSRLRRVIVVTIGKDLSEKAGDHVFRMFYLLLQAVLLEPRTQIFGVVAILDFQHLTTLNFRAQRLVFVNRIVSLCKEGAAVRLKEIHVIRQPYIYNAIFNFSRLCKNDKIKKRTYLHGYDLYSLHKYLAADTLPRDFGGYLPPISYSSADWYQQLKNVEDEFKEWNQCKTIIG